MEIIYRELAADEIAPALFNDFVRRQEVKRCWRKSNGEWVLKDIAFIDDWSRDDYLKLVDDLKRTVREGGFLCAAFAGGVLKGFCAVDGVLKGSHGQYADLEAIHVSADMRGHGMGRELFSRAAQFARTLGAKWLYMSTHSAEESHAFYVTMGCAEAEEYLREHVEAEPCDVQMQFEL